ncbi:MAG: hypothetical protein ACRDDA_04505 [Aeromonas sp.]
MIEDTFADHVMKILVLGSTAGVEDAEVIIVIEGTAVLFGCTNLTNACLLLNLSYPPKLKTIFEVFQKIFLGLDVLKLSPKVSSLHRKPLI